MASLIKVDEMESNSAPLMKFNVGAYNKTEDAVSNAGTVTWNPETSPVVVITNTGEPEPSEVAVYPNVPTVDGMYMTVIYPQGAVVSLSAAFHESTNVPDASAGLVHRVYYSRNSLWRDA